MIQTNYIVAIELSSSKVTGAVGIETINGIKIIATASTLVDGYISKGVVRNVDKTSEAIADIINRLEHDLTDNDGKEITIKRAYVSLAGLTMHSIQSKVTRTFDTYTKISAETISEMELENDALFQVPDGYSKVHVITQEYKVDGKTDHNPIGAPAMAIEGRYLNIVIKKQFLEQLNESFEQVDTVITDSFVAACMDADILLTKDARRNGCALVNIGAETTTVSIYNNDNLCMLKVLPLGSNNITRDLCAEQISYDAAEVIKITRGYKSQASETEPISNETANNIIRARTGEILQNVKYQIEESGEMIHNIIFTGGGSRLKNLSILLEEYLPNFNTSIVSDPQLAFECKPGVNTYGIFTTALYGLLNHGKENCCEETSNEPQPTTLFPENIMSGNDTPEEDTTTIANEEEEARREEEQRKKKEEEDRKKREEELKKKKKKEKEQALLNKIRGFGGLFKEFLQDATSEDEDDDINNEDD